MLYVVGWRQASATQLTKFVTTGDQRKHHAQCIVICCSLLSCKANQNYNNKKVTRTHFIFCTQKSLQWKILTESRVLSNWQMSDWKSWKLDCYSGRCGKQSRILKKKMSCFFVNKIYSLKCNKFWRSYSFVRYLRWPNRVMSILWISFTSKYNSEVSEGIPVGISRNLARLHQTTVPVQLHCGGQYPSPKQPLSSPKKIKIKWR